MTGLNLLPSLRRQPWAFHLGIHSRMPLPTYSLSVTSSTRQGRFKRREALDDAGQLHPVVGRGRLGPGGVADLAAGGVLEDVRPAAGAGVAAARAVGEEPHEIGRGRGIRCHATILLPRGGATRTNARDRTTAAAPAAIDAIEATSPRAAFGRRPPRQVVRINTCGRRRRGRRGCRPCRGRSASWSCWPARGGRGSSRGRAASGSPRRRRRGRRRSGRRGPAPGCWMTTKSPSAMCSSIIELPVTRRANLSSAPSQSVKAELLVLLDRPRSAGRRRSGRPASGRRGGRWSGRRGAGSPATCSARGGSGPSSGGP